ncbi:DEAD/DEAH box helicase, partial [Candidatus Woesearchaeota archaeon]|nr:DEAD/DEAH box helicase [Candidatus Woesearchaeota archaeon]
MNLVDITKEIPKAVFEILSKDIEKLRPAQSKSIQKGLFKGKNLVVCTPTASGKTLIAELAAAKTILEKRAKAVYIVPLKALGSEKYKDFTKRYDKIWRTALSIGDIDSADPQLIDYDLIITPAEKLDS